MRGRRAQIAALAAGLLLAAGGVATAATITVGLGQSGPQPAGLTADWGDTISFVNTDVETHGVMFFQDQLKGGPVPPGGTLNEVVTAQAGSYQYRQTGSKNFSGTIAVTALGSVTLNVRPSHLLYGQRVSLSGVATKPNTSVLIQQRLLGDASWQDAATVTSGPDGTFAASIPLVRGGKLQATLDGGQVRSGRVNVSVAPRLSLAAATHRTKAGRKVVLRAHLTPADSADRITLLACTSDLGRYQPVATASATTSGTASFHWKAFAGTTHLRASVARKDAAQGFATVTSSSVLVIAQGKTAGAKHHRQRPAC